MDDSEHTLAAIRQDIAAALGAGGLLAGVESLKLPQLVDAIGKSRSHAYVSVHRALIELGWRPRRVPGKRTRQYHPPALLVVTTETSASNPSTHEPQQIPSTHEPQQIPSQRAGLPVPEKAWTVVESAMWTVVESAM